MQFGISIPTSREGKGSKPGTVGPQDLIKLAKVADNLGYDSAWANDHLTPSKQIRALHSDLPSYYEIITSLTYCAAVTSRIRIILGVAVLPFRNPVLLAKQIATMDVLSGGRITLGVGIGSDREEFEMLYPRAKEANRGIMLDESLEIIHMLFSQPVSSYKGTYYEFNDVILQPKPIQIPFPIYITGRSAKTIERVVKFGSGLMVFSPTVQQMKTKVGELKSQFEIHGRDYSKIDTVVTTTLSIAKTKEEAIKAFQQSEGVWSSYTGNLAQSQSILKNALSQNLIGTPEEISERLFELKTIGVSHISIRGVAADSTDECIEQWDMFASDVIPNFR